MCWKICTSSRKMEGRAQEISIRRILTVIFLQTLALRNTAHLNICQVKGCNAWCLQLASLPHDFKAPQHATSDVWQFIEIKIELLSIFKAQYLVVLGAIPSSCMGSYYNASQFYHVEMNRAVPSRLGSSNIAYFCPLEWMAALPLSSIAANISQYPVLFKNAVLDESKQFRDAA